MAPSAKPSAPSPSRHVQPKDEPTGELVHEPTVKPRGGSPRLAPSAPLAVGPLLPLERVHELQLQADKCFYDSLATAIAQRHAGPVGCKRAEPAAPGAAVAIGTQPFRVIDALRQVSIDMSRIGMRLSVLAMVCQCTLEVCAGEGVLRDVLFVSACEVAPFLSGTFMESQDVGSWDCNELAEGALLAIKLNQGVVAGCLLALLFRVAASGATAGASPTPQAERLWQVWSALFSAPPPPPLVPLAAAESVLQDLSSSLTHDLRCEFGALTEISKLLRAD